MQESATQLLSLINAAKKADGSQLQDLLENYRHYLNLLARSWLDQSLRAKAGASDLVQQTMLNAHLGFGDFRGKTEAELTAWLRRILLRNLTELIRHYQTAARKISRDRPLEEMVIQSSQHVDEVIAAAGSSPSYVAARREMGLILADALNDLSDSHREVVLLRNFEQLNWDEIAAKMNGSANSVRKLWSRALEQLRPLIEDRQ